MYYILSRGENVSSCHKVKLSSSILYHSGMDLANLNLVNNNLTSLFIGTPLYKGVSFNDISRKVTRDFFENTLELQNLKGNYCFLFIKDDKINILQDVGKQISLFYDKKTKSLSNSLLQLVNLREEDLKPDEEGILEEMALGFNLTEKTVFKDIIKVTTHNQELVQDELNVKFISQRKLDVNQIQFHKKGKDKSIQQQINHLENYFQLINKTFEGKTGDLGLSGGFDCRMLLALAQNGLDEKLHLHTHFTRDVHESQMKYADLLAKEYGQSLEKIETTSPSKLSNDELTKMLEDNFNFFDGRSARHLGAYSQTYTAWYKEASMGKSFYSLNGLGGEIYRDSYFTGTRRMEWNDWAKRYLFLPTAYDILPKEQLDNLSEELRKIIISELNWGEEYYDILFTHAYYGLIKMPICNGNLVAAYNKVSPFLLPFIEPDNVIEALKGIPHFGKGGQYQAAMMSKLSPELAEIPNHYGGNFANLSFKYLVWSYIKTKGSLKRREKLTLKHLKQKAQSKNHQLYLETLYNHNVTSEILQNLQKIKLGLDIPLALTDSTQKRNLIFIGYLLNKYFRD